jgi:hypothetical protein
MWRRPPALRHSTAAVSLHSHTLHSRERLDFIPRACGSLPALGAAVRHASRCHQIRWENAWWTPPLGGGQAWLTETNQIAALDLAPLVSLTDHDDIEAPLQLQVAHGPKTVPLSVEWTVPWATTSFHLGIHNLPDVRLWSSMKSAGQDAIRDLLAVLHSHPEVLIVFNHPFWDERGIGQTLHAAALHSFMAKCAPFIHAIELNGLRSWSENGVATELAAARGKPVISGGDRHGREPNACLNLTRAATFSDFVSEIRSGHSRVLFMNQYRESRVSRIAQNVREVLRSDHSHSLGWSAWNDRIFYELEDGRIRSLRELWGEESPLWIRCFLAAADLAASAPLRSALRVAFPPDRELA